MLRYGSDKIVDVHIFMKIINNSINYSAVIERHFTGYLLLHFTNPEHKLLKSFFIKIKNVSSKLRLYR